MTEERLTQRRMYTTNFYEHVSENRLEDFQNNLANEGRFWIGHILGETMLRTAGPDAWCICSR